MAGQVLTSWKEIAAYLGKGVRTVQRWETELGLPVRRPGSERHIVLALPTELDDWARQQHSCSKGHSDQDRSPEAELKLSIVPRDASPEMQRLRTLIITMIDRASHDREQTTRLIRHCERFLEKKTRQKVPA
jgi:hypothetical protein